MSALVPAAVSTPDTTGKRVWLIVLLDRTGSMAALKQETETAFNHFINDQRAATAELGDDVRVFLAQFDAYANRPPVESVYEDIPLANVPPLVLHPRGSTPLNDAMGQTITQVRAHLNRQPTDTQPRKVIFVTITDGEENASRTWTLDRIKALVESETANGWDFVFLGVGIDAFTVAGGYGIKPGMTVSTAATAAGTQSGYDQTSWTVRNVRSGKADDQT